MDYEEWIKREQRIRIKILENSPAISKKKIYRLCRDCGEVCLCHEQMCPNCNNDNIMERYLSNLDEESQKRVRCRFRFEHLFR